MTATQFHAAPLTDDETDALTWLDEQMESDFSARIRRYKHCWTLSLHGGAPHTDHGSYFVGQPNETLRQLILNAYHTAVMADAEDDTERSGGMDDTGERRLTLADRKEMYGGENGGDGRDD